MSYKLPPSSLFLFYEGAGYTMDFQYGLSLKPHNFKWSSITFSPLFTSDLESLIYTFIYVLGCLFGIGEKNDHFSSEFSILLFEIHIWLNLKYSMRLECFLSFRHSLLIFVCSQVPFGVNIYILLNIWIFHVRLGPLFKKEL